MKKVLIVLVVLSILSATFNCITISAESKVESPNLYNSADMLLDEEMAVYISCEDSRCEIDDTILVSLVVTDITENISEMEICYFENGLKILDIDQCNEKVDICLKYVSHTEEGSLEIDIIAQDKSKINFELCAISTDKGIFISKSSFESAWDEYFYSGVTDGEYSFEEYNRRLSKYLNENASDCISDITVTSTGNIARSLNTITFSGNIQWKDDYNVSHPLQYNKLCVYDDGNGIILATTHTDIYGNYSCSFQENLITRDLCIIVYAGNDHAMVKTWNYGTYAYYSEVIPAVAGGDFVTVNATITMSTILGQAFQISQAVNVAAEYAKAMEGSYLPYVTVRYPHEGNSTGCYYQKSSQTINITNRSENIYMPPYASWDAIMHEYGHHLQYHYNIENNPGGGHSLGIDLALNRSKDEGIRLAWGEAYPTAFALMAQQYFLPSLQNIYSVGDACYQSYSVQFKDIDNGIYDKGEACEGSILASLWDMYDTNNSEAHDNMSFSHSMFWSMITDSSATTMSEFAQYFVNNYADYIGSFGAILSYNNISASGVLYNSSSRTICWVGNGMASANNNEFRVEILTGFDVVVFSKTVNTTSLTLTSAELEMIREDCGSHVIIYAYQTASPRTGGYPSECIMVDF